MNLLIPMSHVETNHVWGLPGHPLLLCRTR